MSVSTGSFDYSKDRVQASTAADAPYVHMLEQITELDNEISADIDCLVDMKEQVEWMMHSFTPKQQAVIRSRYFHSYSWEDIAMLLGCTVRNVHYIHQAALQNMDRKML
ncbi:MAG: hypothetical protein LIO86_15310 [Lachnospiraceae bacterium]|nr:hypothetical protein [Lachnospiraceae bacterium]